MSLSPASSSANSDADSTYHEDDVLICLWKKCNRQFDDAETMYSHLSVDHVGRKSTGNLCLDCCWDDCDVRTSKRDHITSHLRVHVPLKPHVCETCKKAFKRPQDLKKHYKIHSESHQQQLTSLKNHRISRKLPARPPTPPYYHPYHIDHHHRHHHHSNNCNNDNNHHQEFQPQPQPQPPRQCYADELSGSPIIPGYNSSSLSPYSNPSSPASSFSSSPRNSSSSLSSSLSASPISSSINSLPIYTTNTITSPTLNSISLRSRRPGSMSTTTTTTTTTNMDYQETFYPPPHIQHIHQSPSLMPSLINRDGSSPKSISNERLPSISYALSHAGSMPPITGFPQKDTFLR